MTKDKLFISHEKKIWLILTTPEVNITEVTAIYAKTITQSKFMQSSVNVNQNSQLNLTNKILFRPNYLGKALKWEKNNKSSNDNKHVNK